MKNGLLFTIMVMLGFAVTTITLSSQQEVFADKPSNPNCIAEEVHRFTDTSRGVGDEFSALAHEEGPGERRGAGDNVQEFREAAC